MKKFFLILLFNFTLIVLNCHAQCDTIAFVCAKHIMAPFISDGQQYRSLLLTDQTAEFHTTFYGGGTYRIAACCGLSDGNLIFSVYDEERNLIFSNRDVKNVPFWDFKITSTLNVIIEANLNTTAKSGCAVLLIGFKQ
ncbi:MAG: hypothetical protein V1781_02075 [Bacteroidota bacterium]